MAQVIIRVYNSKLIAKPGVAAPDWFDLDVDQATSPLKLDISAVEVGELGTNFGIGSQQFTLPNTPTNNNFFNYAFNVNSEESGFTFQKSFSCQILVDGGSIASGKLYFDSVTTDNKGKHFYNCTFSDAVSSITDIYKDTLIADLDWSAYTHNFTIQNVTGSWDNLLFSGSIIYPNVLYGYPENDTTWAWDANYFAFDAQANAYVTSNNIPLNAFKPAVRVKTIFDKIFDSINYEYESNFITTSTSSFGTGVTASFSDLYMLMTPNAELGPTISTPVADAEHFKTSAYTANINAVFIDFNLSNTLTGGTEVFDPLGMINFNVDNTITFPLGGNYRMEPGFTFRPALTNDYIVRLKNVSTGQYWDLLSGPLQANVDYTHNQSIELLDIVAGYSYEFKIEILAPGLPTVTTATFSNNNFKIDNIAYDSGPVDMAIQFGDLKVADFLKGLSEQFNLVWWADKENPKKVYIEPWNAYIKTGTELDWSNKVDYSVNWQISHPSADAEKTILFTNVEDDDSPNQYYIVNDNVSFGSYTYQAQSDYAEGEKTIGNSFFAPTIVKPIPGTNAVSAQSNMTIPHIYTDGYLPRPRLVKFKPRLLFKNGKQNYSFPYSVASQTLTTYYQMSPVTTLNYGAAKFDLNFSSYNWYWGADNVVSYDHYTDNDSFNVFWANYINNIYRNPARKVTLNIKFEPVDLFQFRVNDVIFIDGQTYLINKISGFDLLKPTSTQVELIKALYPSYNKPVFIVEGNDDIQVPGQGDPGDDNVGNEWVFEPDTGNPVRVVPTDIVNGGTISVDSIKKTLIRQQGFLPSGSSAVWKNVRWDKQTLNTNIKDNLQYGINAGGVQSPNTITLGGKNDVNSVTSNVLVTGNTNTVSLSNKNLNVIGDNNSLELGNANLLYIGNNSNSGIRYFKNSIIMDIVSGSNTLNNDSVEKTGIFALNKGIVLEGAHSGSVVIANVNTGTNITSIGKTGYSVDNSFFMGNDNSTISPSANIINFFAFNNTELNLNDFDPASVQSAKNLLLANNNDTYISGGFGSTVIFNDSQGEYRNNNSSQNSAGIISVNNTQLKTQGPASDLMAVNGGLCEITGSVTRLFSANDYSTCFNRPYVFSSFNNSNTNIGMGRTAIDFTYGQYGLFANNSKINIVDYSYSTFINNKGYQFSAFPRTIVSKSNDSIYINNENVFVSTSLQSEVIGNKAVGIDKDFDYSILFNNHNTTATPARLAKSSNYSAWINNNINTSSAAFETEYSTLINNSNVVYTGNDSTKLQYSLVANNSSSNINLITDTYNGETLKGYSNMFLNNINSNIKGTFVRSNIQNNVSFSGGELRVKDSTFLNTVNFNVPRTASFSASVVIGDTSTSYTGSYQNTAFLNNHKFTATGSNIDRSTFINNSGSLDSVGSGNTIINLRGNNHVIGGNKTIIGYNGTNNQLSYSNYSLDENTYATFVGTPDISIYNNGPAISVSSESLYTGKQFHYGPQYHGYEFVVGASGSTNTLSAKSANTVLLDWFSTAGTSTLNLPLASDHDGRRIYFKATGNISATKTIRLATTGGERIDANLTYDINRAYQANTLMAMDGQWWLIAYN